MSIGATFWNLLEALEESGPIAALRESYLAYPLVNSLHVIGIALLFGSIVAMDLRLIGWRREAGEPGEIARLLLPVAIAGLALAVPAGLLLFATDARAYAASPLFQTKMLLIALAIANALWVRSINWGAHRRRAAFGAAASILLWLGVILCGRLVGYF